MASDYLPWLQTAVQDARDLLGVGGPEWHFFVSVEDNPHGCDRAAAATVVDCLNVDIRFRPDLPLNNTTRQQVLHEVMHVALSSLDNIAFSFFDGSISGRGLLARRLYEDEQERTIQRVTRALTNGLRPVDP